ncbi:UNVERIFIED_CONTAM: hypothetical protein RMT77_019256 [Armadillidium vulgare]
MNSKKSLSLKKYTISDRNILDKKTHPSLKYSNVKPKTNTGFNSEKRIEIEKEILKYYKVRNDEIFRRISLGDLIQLMVAFADEVNLIGLPVTYDSKANSEGSEKSRVNNVDKTDEKNSSHNFQILKNSEVQIPQNSNTIPKELQPFLILDVRTENEFKECHLATAAWHDRSRLSRAIGWESIEMRDYKNKEDKLIVVYDNNEALSGSVATMLIHRGYLNIFVLSGGLRLAYDKIGFPLVTNDLSRALTPDVANFLSEKLKNVTVHSALCLEAVPSSFESKSVISRYDKSDLFTNKNMKPKKAPWR